MTSDYPLQGKIAVVTGAGRGIGKSIALAFAAAGADIAICARSESELDAVKDSIEDMGRTCFAPSVDLSNPKQATTFCKDVIGAFNHVDIIVNNAGAYFERTECVAGVQDMRFQDLMPDVFSWLGISHIDRFISMSDMKHDALAAQGITVGERVPIPDDLIPPDAQVEMDAKKAAGYFVNESVSTPTDLTKTQGRALDDY